MKIENKFSLVTGLVFLVADAILITAFVIGNGPTGASWGLLLMRFLAVFLSYEQKGEYTASVFLIPAIIALTGNVTQEWREKYGWVPHLPAILLIVAPLIAWIFL